MGQRDVILDRLEAELRESLARNGRMLDELAGFVNGDERGEPSADRS